MPSSASLFASHGDACMLPLICGVACLLPGDQRLYRAFRASRRSLPHRSRISLAATSAGRFRLMRGASILMPWRPYSIRPLSCACKTLYRTRTIQFLSVHTLTPSFATGAASTYRSGIAASAEPTLTTRRRPGAGRAASRYAPRASPRRGGGRAARPTALAPQGGRGARQTS